MLRIRAFRAIDHYNLCLKFIEGHTRVLDAVGVKQVTSSNDEWAYNPGAFVILVESDDGQKVLGGARVHAVGGNQPLPLEEATGYMDSRIYNVIRDYSMNGTGEVCGLWNSIEVAGLGIGSIFLIRAALAISDQIGLQSMFALCSPYTTRIAGNYGFLVETGLGNNGTFYYPKIDLLATIVLQKDAPHLTNATVLESDRIFDLRNRPQQQAREEGRKNTIEIDYDLSISSANTEEFKLAGKMAE
ncbi:MAG: hypothetical protein ACHQK8_02345 [Bacteroidia bacterium]